MVSRDQRIGLAVSFRSRPNMEFLSEAPCRGTYHTDGDLFFELGRFQEAYDSYCSRCPVRRRCLDYALAQEDDCTWGGVPDVNRRRWKKLRWDADIMLKTQDWIQAVEAAKPSEQRLALG